MREWARKMVDASRGCCQKNRFNAWRFTGFRKKVVRVGSIESAQIEECGVSVINCVFPTIFGVKLMTNLTHDFGHIWQFFFSLSAKEIERECLRETQPCYTVITPSLFARFVCVRLFSSRLCEVGHMNMLASRGRVMIEEPPFLVPSWF